MEKPKTSAADILMFGMLVLFGLIQMLVDRLLQLVCVARYGSHDWQVQMFRGKVLLSGEMKCPHCGKYKEV